MASRRSIEFGKRKRGAIVKCGGSSVVKYEKAFCMCIVSTEDLVHRIEWYLLNISSTRDEEKAKKEMRSKQLRQIPSLELQGAYLAFHHNERHPRRGKKKPAVLPLIAQLNEKPKSGLDYRFGASCAVVGSTIYRFGGPRGIKPWSRKVTYFDASCPEEGWKRGPRTLFGRKSAATLTLNGKLYVFGGCQRDIDGCCAEFLDTTTLVEEKGKTKGEWCPLPDPPCALGFKELFVVVIDGGLYAGKILVGSKLSGAIFLHDEIDKFWTSLGFVKFYGGLVSPPVVVDTTIYWISFAFKKLHAYDFLQKTKLSMWVGDFEIFNHMCDRGVIPILLHLAADMFCVVWGGEDGCLHCTKLQVSTAGLIGATVLCCHSYHFGQEVYLRDCLPMNPSLVL